MAILIGVIALAVIPNIQKSRESKDLSNLDGALSALNVAASNAKPTDGAHGKVSDLLATGKTDAAANKKTFASEAYTNAGETVQNASSSAAIGTSSTDVEMMYCISMPSTGKATIIVWYGADKGKIDDAKSAAGDRNYSKEDGATGTDAGAKFYAMN